MTKTDELRAFAQECQRMADGARNPDDKRQWLKLAQSWLNLIPKRRPNATQAFDAENDARGTGQVRSGSSH
jgi:hypothetical protein